MKIFSLALFGLAASDQVLTKKLVLDFYEILDGRNRGKIQERVRREFEAQREVLHEIEWKRSQCEFIPPSPESWLIFEANTILMNLLNFPLSSRFGARREQSRFLF